MAGSNVEQSEYNNTEYQRAYRHENSDKINEYRRKWLAEKGYPYRESGKEYERLHPTKAKARIILHNAVKEGIIKKPENCEECGKEGEVIGFRYDDNEPLDVLWVCRRCFYYKNKAKQEEVNEQRRYVG